MKTVWIDKKMTYDGTQLHSGFVAEASGNSDTDMISFIGEADVPIENMVDLEDIRNNAPIYSKSMLHFIIEHPEHDLPLAVARQWLLTAIISEAIGDCGCKKRPLRRGDDIYIDDRKLTVSIATSSATTTLIHLGINIISDGAPVAAIGLDELGIESENFAAEIMGRYAREIAKMRAAAGKVRTVD
jgi:uncharacterized protein